jgi:solute carrier family 13 (sodium-dependent dicarboxylate transporter), member 2/3/5
MSSRGSDVSGDAASAGDLENRPAWVYYLLIAGILAAAACYFVGPPAAVSANGWHALGLLIPIIIVWATEAIPVGVASMVFLALIVIFRLAPPAVALKGFTTDLPWLILGAFTIGRAMERTGLSRRLTYLLLSRLKGLGGTIIAIYAVDVCFMGVPSSEARSGVLAPFLDSILATIGRPTKSNLSRFITYCFCNATNAFVGNMFLTGGAANVLLVGLYAQLTGISLSWGQWFILMALSTLLFSFVAVCFAWLFSRPEPALMAKMRDSDAMAAAYAAMGPMTADEWKVLVIYLLAVVAWIVGGLFHVAPGFAALVIMALLFLPRIGVLPRRAVREINWDIVLVLGTVTGVAGILDQTGMLKAISNVLVAPILDPLAQFGLFGIALGCIIVGFVAHWLLPGPANLTLALPLLVTWGMQIKHLPMPVVLAFLVLLSALGDKLIMLPYQVPTYYTFLAMDVTDIPRFNALLFKLYPVLAVTILIGSFIAYGIMLMTGIGA